jgi:hypothetical protein
LRFGHCGLLAGVETNARCEPHVPFPQSPAERLAALVQPSHDGFVVPAKAGTHTPCR